VNRKKGSVNTVRAKKDLADVLEKTLERTKNVRFLTTTEEGQAVLAKREYELACDEKRGEFAVGQLVWKDVLAENLSDVMGNGMVVARCSRIVSIDKTTVDTEFLYIMLEGHKYDSYTDTWGNIISKGDKSGYFGLLELEKHVAKSGNTWWKIKQI